MSKFYVHNQNTPILENEVAEANTPKLPNKEYDLVYARSVLQRCSLESGVSV